MKTISEVISLHLDTIAEIKNIDRDKIVVSSSICADELNHTRQLYESTHRMFQLGGLAGYPLTGLTGINAYLDHIPAEGAAYVIYGPHIGKSKTGHMGKLFREKQERETISCGALWALFSEMQQAVLTGEIDFEHNDYQLDFLRYKVQHLKKQEEYRDFTKFTYAFLDIIKEDLLKIIDHSNIRKYPFPIFHASGVVINTEEGNFFDLKSFDEFVK